MPFGLCRYGRRSDPSWFIVLLSVPRESFSAFSAFASSSLSLSRLAPSVLDSPLSPFSSSSSAAAAAAAEAAAAEAAGAGAAFLLASSPPCSFLNTRCLSTLGDLGSGYQALDAYLRGLGYQTSVSFVSFSVCPSACLRFRRPPSVSPSPSLSVSLSDSSSPVSLSLSFASSSADACSVAAESPPSPSLLLSPSLAFLAEAYMQGDREASYRGGGGGGEEGERRGGRGEVPFS